MMLALPRGSFDTTTESTTTTVSTKICAKIDLLIIESKIDPECGLDSDISCFGTYPNIWSWNQSHPCPHPHCNIFDVHTTNAVRPDADYVAVPGDLCYSNFWGILRS